MLHLNSRLHGLLYSNTKLEQNTRKNWPKDGHKAINILVIQKRAENVFLQTQND